MYCDSTGIAIGYLDLLRLNGYDVVFIVFFCLFFVPPPVLIYVLVYIVFHLFNLGFYALFCVYTVYRIIVF